jgi:hypothetical protein
MQLSRHVPADAGLLFDKEVKKALCVMTNLSSSGVIIRMRWAGCVVCMKQTIVRYRAVISVGSHRRK